MPADTPDAQRLPDFSRRIEGPTPAGGAYAIGYFRDAAGDPCPESEAASIEIVEFTRDGRVVGRTHGGMHRPG